MMQKLKKQLQSIQPVYFIGGGIISLLLVFLILTPALEIGSDKIKGNSFPYLFAMITGSILLFLLLMRHFLSRKFRTLRNYYLMAAVISFTVTLMLLVLFVSFIHSEITLTSYGEMDEETVGNILSLVMFGCCTAVFLLCFHLLTKNKSQYVSYICENVSKIAETDKPVEIRERGGDELEQISASINRMAKELAEKRSREQALERQRSELITNVSHDLRSPLTSIIGYVRLLKENGCRDEAKFNETAQADANYHGPAPGGQIHPCISVLRRLRHSIRLLFRRWRRPLRHNVDSQPLAGSPYEDGPAR